MLQARRRIDRQPCSGRAFGRRLRHLWSRRHRSPRHHNAERTWAKNLAKALVYPAVCLMKRRSMYANMAVRVCRRIACPLLPQISSAWEGLRWPSGSSNDRRSTRNGTPYSWSKGRGYRPTVTVAEPRIHKLEMAEDGSEQLRANLPFDSCLHAKGHCGWAERLTNRREDNRGKGEARQRYH